MKRVVLIVMLMCVSFVLRAQYDNFYYANGVSTINLTTYHQAFISTPSEAAMML